MARGSVPSVSQTTRGAPPCICPPSAFARMHRAPGIHASATRTSLTTCRTRGLRPAGRLERSRPYGLHLLLTSRPAFSPEGPVEKISRSARSTIWYAQRTGRTAERSPWHREHPEAGGLALRGRHRERHRGRLRRAGDRGRDQADRRRAVEPDLLPAHAAT